MGEVIKFRRAAASTPRRQATGESPRRPPAVTAAEGNTLCRSGFHKWKVVTEKRFDVRQGRLVTVLCCERCGKEKTELR